MSPVESQTQMRMPAALLDRGELARVRENRRLERQGLRTSPFDIVSSLLLASIFFSSAFVLLSFLIWLTRGPSEPHRSIPPVEFGSQNNETSIGSEDEFEEPTASEIESLQEPSLEETIEAVTDVAGTVAVSAEAVASDSASDSSSDEKASSPGSLRSPGPEIDGDSVIPRYERWQLEFSANDLADYAKQLDGFGIELASLGSTRQYVSNLSTKPNVRVASNEAPRIYFVFTSPSQLQKFDTQLLRKAGVDVQGSEIAKFISAELESRLAQIEFEYAQSNDAHEVSTIIKTVFESKRIGGSYDFRVIEQRYRKEPRSAAGM